MSDDALVNRANSWSRLDNDRRLTQFEQIHSEASFADEHVADEPSDPDLAHEPVGPQNPVVLIIRDSQRNSVVLDEVSWCLNIRTDHISTCDDLPWMLHALRPIAVVTDLDGDAQDGYHVMMTVAGYDPTLPMLLIGENDPALLGAVDAIQEIWRLSNITIMPGALDIGGLVDFLCRAYRG